MLTTLRLFVPALALAAAVTPATGQLPPLPKDGQFPPPLVERKGADEFRPPLTGEKKPVAEKLTPLTREKQPGAEKLPQSREKQPGADKLPLPEKRLFPQPIPLQRPADEDARRIRELEEQRRLAEERLRKLKGDSAPKVAETPATPLRMQTETKKVEQADPLAALKPLLRSTDPKVAALAKELLDRLSGSGSAAGGQAGEGRRVVTLESGRLVTGTKGDPVKVVVAVEKSEKTTASTLRMSEDGKSAAVVGADGGVTIYDVASGKVTASFPARK